MKTPKILRVIFYGVFLLLLAEITTRMFFEFRHINFEVYRNYSFSREPGMMMPDQLLGWKLMPQVSRNAFTSEFQTIYTTNSLGLREKEIRDTSGFKVLFLGDSNTFGEGVPLGSRFSDLVEKDIPAIQSINAGVPGYGIHQMLEYLRSQGLALKPDLVICTILREDLRRSLFHKIETASHILPALPPAPATRKYGTGWPGLLRELKVNIMDHSYFLTWTYVKVRIMILWNALRERDSRIWNEIFANTYQKTRGLKQKDQWRLIIEESQRIFRDMKHMLESSRTDLLVVNITKHPIPWLQEFLVKENIEYLDVSEQIQNTPHTHFDIDPHLNTLGHRIVADHLEKYLRERYQSRLSS